MKKKNLKLKKNNKSLFLTFNFIQSNCLIKKNKKTQKEGERRKNANFTI